MDFKKTNLVLIGMPGSGKTTIGKKVSKLLKMEFYDVDVFIEKKEKKRISEMFVIGEDYFRNKETEAIEELYTKSSVVISTGGGAVKREENMTLLRNTGFVVFINRPLEKIMADVDTEHRPLLKDKKDSLSKLYDERIGLYKKYCDFEILNNGSIKKITEDIVAKFKEEISQ